MKPYDEQVRDILKAMLQSELDAGVYGTVPDEYAELSLEGCGGSIKEVPDGT